MQLSEITVGRPILRCPRSPEGDGSGTWKTVLQEISSLRHRFMHALDELCGFNLDGELEPWPFFMHLWDLLNGWVELHRP